MIDYATARKIVEQFLPECELYLGTPAQILDEKTIEYEWGWRIYINAKDLAKISPERTHKYDFGYLVDRLTGACIARSTSGGTWDYDNLMRLREVKLAQMQRDQAESLSLPPKDVS